VLVCRVFPFDINMQIKTALFIAIAIGCASAENATYIGCYADTSSVHTRDLPVFYCSNGVDPSASWDCAFDDRLPTQGQRGYAGYSAMTVQYCSSMCKGFKFFGLQNGGECYCGNDYGEQGGKVPEANCDEICQGSPIEICGGDERNSIYAQPPSMYQNTTTSSH
jgi:hypothetical protein